MKKLLPWLLLLLVFFAGIAVGVVGTRKFAQNRINNFSHNPEELRDRIERDLARKLDLTEDQRTKLHEIMVQSHAEMRELRTEIQPRYASVWERTDARISEILTPDQDEKFKEISKQRKMLWRGGPPIKRPPGSPNSPSPVR